MDEFIVLGVLGLALVLFVTERVRYDLVALGALVVLTVVGIVPAADAYKGFGHPAVVTVAAVLVLSRVLQGAGIVDVLGRWYTRIGQSVTVQVASLSGLVAALSAFMNNVGALSLLMPLAVRVAKSGGRPYSPYLMPLAFSSLLGGMTTLVGTPPNIIISAFRQDVTGSAFNMFDFTPVGLGLTVAGLAFIAVVGWRLIPVRESQGTLGDAMEIADYLAEVRVTSGSRFVGRFVRDLEEAVEQDVAIVGLLHKGTAYGAPSSYQIIDAGDIFVVEASPEDLQGFIDETGFVVEAPGNVYSDIDKAVGLEDVTLMEAVVVPNSLVRGQTARTLRLHAIFGVNLLGVSRRGTKIATRLSRVMLRSGDVLLLQGKSDLVRTSLTRLGLLPLADRDLQLIQTRRLVFPVVVFAGALLLTAFNVLPVEVSMVFAVVALLLSRVVSLQAAYQAVNWPVIVLLGAMIPVGEALETTGGAGRIALMIFNLSDVLQPWMLLGIVLVVTMLLSAIVSNATAVILMAPIGIRVAESLGASVEPFLMAVAIGGSSAFLSPIGHQSNTIVMGPGGYRFGDFWRMGLPLAVIVVVVSVPLVMWFWPLGV